jgi:flavocytochrome c
MSYLGGNSVICGGGMNAVIPERQSKQNIKDSKKLFLDQTLSAGDYRGDPVKVSYLVEKSQRAFEWLANLGVPFIDQVVQTFGNSWPREHTMKGGGAIGVKIIVNQLRKRKIPIFTNYKVVNIIRENPSNGRVLGVEVETKNRSLFLRAKKGLILASGGFAADIQLIKRFDPRIDERFSTTNHLGATGECILLAEDNGAGTVGMDYVQYMGISGPDIRSSSDPLKRKYPPIRRIFNVASIDRTLICDLQGLRIVASDARRDVISNAVLATNEKVALVLSDDKARDDKDEIEQNRTQRSATPMKKAIEIARLNPDSIFSGQTIRELAENIGINPSTLKKTIVRYNSFVDKKLDLDFGQSSSNLKHRIDTPPYWAGTTSPSTHYTMGGLNINVCCQVLDHWGREIPGLYAAGEVTGGIHGTNRVGGNAITDCIVFGRTAGKNAAKKEA